MIIYTVQEPGQPSRSVEENVAGLAFIKEGFTWWGFIFGPLWLLFNGLWFEFVFALLLSAGVAAGLMALGLGDAAGPLAELFLMLLIGFEGNNLRRWRLERKGYRMLAAVAGSGIQECERRFFDAWLPTLGHSAVKPAVKPAGDAGPQSWGGWSGPGAIGSLPGEVV